MITSDSDEIKRWYVSNIDINSITCIDDSSDTCRSLPLDCVPVEKKKNSFISTIDTISINNSLSVPNTLKIIFRCKKNELKQ